MIKRLSLVTVLAALALTPAYASLNNDNNAVPNNVAVRVVQHANPQKQASVSAAIQLNLNKSAAEVVFAKAQEIKNMLPAGIVADASSNTPHVTLETFEPVAGGNLSDAQLADLKKKLASVAPQVVRNGANDLEIVPVELKLIAKFEGQANKYYTKDNIDELAKQEGKMTECYLAYSCDVKQGNKVVDGTTFLKSLQPLLHNGLGAVKVNHGPFAANPLCHVTLMKWKILQGQATVADFCKTLFALEAAVENKPFAVDKLALNPMFAGDKGQDAEFRVHERLDKRSKTDWGAEPRAYVSMLDIETQKLEKMDEIKAVQQQIDTHRGYMGRVDDNARKYAGFVLKSRADIETHEGYMEKTRANIRANPKNNAGFRATLEKQDVRWKELDAALKVNEANLVPHQRKLQDAQATLVLLQGKLKVKEAELVALQSQKEVLQPVVVNVNNNNNAPIQPIDPTNELALLERQLADVERQMLAIPKPSKSDFHGLLDRQVVLYDAIEELRKQQAVVPNVKNNNNIINNNNEPAIEPAHDEPATSLFGTAPFWTTDLSKLPADFDAVQYLENYREKLIAEAKHFQISAPLLYASLQYLNWGAAEKNTYKKK